LRRSTSVLTAAVLGTALSATTLIAQQTAPTSGPEMSNAFIPGTTASRGARYLLRNGWDYLKYQEYERSLKFFMEAQAKQAELNPSERLALTQAIDQARRGMREAGDGSARKAYAGRGPIRRPGALALAKTPKPAQAQEPASNLAASPAREPIQLASATSPSEPARNALPQLPADAPSTPEMNLPPLPLDATVVAAKANVDSETVPANTESGLAPLLAPPSTPVLSEPSALAEQPVAEPTPAPAPAALSTPTPTSMEVAKPGSVAEPAASPELAPLDLGGIPLPPLSNDPAKAEPAAPQDAPAPTAVPEPSPESAPAIPPAVEPGPTAEAGALPNDEPPAVPPPAGADAAPTPPPSLPGAMELPTPAELPANPEALPSQAAQPEAGAEVESPAAALPAPAEVAAPASGLAPPPEIGAEPVRVAEQPEGFAPSAEMRPEQGPDLSDETLPPLPAEEVAPPRAPAREVAAPRSTNSLIPQRDEEYVSGLSPKLQQEVDRVAQRQEDDMRALREQQPPAASGGSASTPGDPEGLMSSPSMPSPRLEITRAPSPTEARPIRAIPVPDEFVPLPKREWEPLRKYWSAAAVCHMPLYFQDAALERYGEGAEQYLGTAGRYVSYPVDDPTQSLQRNQLLQPFVSIGRFAAQIAFLPYNLVMDPPWEAEYDLGYYRPGDRVPTDTYYFPKTGVGPPLRGKNY